MLELGLGLGHDYTIGTLDMLQTCDACADMGMTYSVIDFTYSAVYRLCSLSRVRVRDRVRFRVSLGIGLVIAFTRSDPKTEKTPQ